MAYDTRTFLSNAPTKERGSPASLLVFLKLCPIRDLGASLRSRVKSLQQHVAGSLALTELTCYSPRLVTLKETVYLSIASRAACRLIISFAAGMRALYELVESPDVEPGSLRFT
jgi:hypothetical protein